ncbi:hypothetical protein D3C87_1833300 [compost metagenome]
MEGAGPAQQPIAVGRRRVAPQSKVAVGKAPPLAKIGPAIGLPDKEQTYQPYQGDGKQKLKPFTLVLPPHPERQQGQH